MKLKFTNEKAVEAWFDRVTKCGPDDPSLGVSGSNILGRGHTLYSYGTHFPLARWFPAQRVFLTNYNEHRSNSTSKHQNYVHRHVPDNHIEVGELLGSDPFKCPEEFLNRWNKLIFEILAKGRRARKHKDSYLGVAGRYLIDRERFIDAFRLPARFIQLPEDVTAALVTLKLAA